MVKAKRLKNLHVQENPELASEPFLETDDELREAFGALEEENAQEATKG